MTTSSSAPGSGPHSHTDPHPPIGAYLLKIMNPAEALAAEQHLTGCAACQAELAHLANTERQLANLLEDPAAMEPAWLDADQLIATGSAQANDTLLQRTLRQIRSERGHNRRNRVLGVAAAAVLLLGGVAVGGVVIGRHTAGTSTQAAPPAAGIRSYSATSTAGVHISATVIPHRGWTSLQVHLTGEPANVRCQLIGVAADGTRLIAGSWTVGANHNGPDGTKVIGSLAISAAQLQRIDIQTLLGQPIVSINT
jgi:anti-sigma factor RsiW